LSSRRQRHTLRASHFLDRNTEYIHTPNFFNMRPTQLLAAVVAMSSVTNALTDAFDNIHGMSDVKDVLFGRQDSTRTHHQTLLPMHIR
jgi:hypothetical protein